MECDFITASLVYDQNFHWDIQYDSKLFFFHCHHQFGPHQHKCRVQVSRPNVSHCTGELSYPQVWYLNIRDAEIRSPWPTRPFRLGRSWAPVDSRRFSIQRNMLGSGPPGVGGWVVVLTLKFQLQVVQLPFDNLIALPSPVPVRKPW